MSNKSEVFEFTNYRAFLRVYADRTEGSERRSGELKKIAEAARIFPSYLSQILAGKRDLTLDQAIQVADHCGLGQKARKYFLLLVQLSRASTARLKSELEKEMREIKAEHMELSSRLPNQKELSIEDSAQFYSSWLYIAARLYTAVTPFQSLEALSAKLGCTKNQMKNILKFLVQTGLCIEPEPGKYRYGPTHMHLSSDHPLITKHHANWRARAMEKHVFLDQSKELAYSGILTLSRSDSQKIRRMLPNWIDQIRTISDPSPSETVFCLNMDWFEV